MNYWITVHWPQRVGEGLKQDVYLQDGREDAGRDLAPDDHVFLYETASAPASIKPGPDGPRRVPIIAAGRQGIMALVRLKTALYDRNNKPSDLSDGRQMWWRWKADAEIVTTDGFVARAEANEILGYSRAWNWRGFGDRRSGLRRITEQEYRAILAKFDERA